MPIYEYICEACNESHDALQKINDAPLKHCPTCASPALVKQVSAPSFRLSGSGWYETDFKSGNKRNIADKGKESSSSPSSSPAHNCGTGGCGSCS